jgi:hypothetical protein
MKSKSITGIMLMVLLLCALTLAFNVQQVESDPLPQIFLNPSQYSARLDEFFTIEVNVSEVTDYYGFDMWLHYNNTIIERVNITVDGLGQVAPTDPGHRITTDVSVLGTIKYSCVFVGAAGTPSFNGSGTLAWITFSATNVGSTALNFNTFWTNLYYRNATVIPMGPPLNGSVTVGSPVGGIYIPVNKLSLLAPYVGLTTLLATVVVIVIHFKRRES